MYVGASEALVRKFTFPDGPYHGIGGFNGVLHGLSIDINLQKESAALGLIEQSNKYPGVQKNDIRIFS